MARTPADKFFTALNEAYDAMLDAIEKGNQRGYRVSRTMLREARRGRREAITLAKKWSEGPTDLLRFYESLLDAQTRAQTRALELTREWLDEFGGARGDVGQALRGMIQANRAAGEAVIEGARGAFGRAFARLQGEEPGTEQPAPAAARRKSRSSAVGGPGRRASRGRTARSRSRAPSTASRERRESPPS